MVTIQQIKYFVTTVEQRSLSVAARKLHVSVQAVSRGLFEFESYFKRDLFVRKPHGVEPTPIGLALYKRAQDVLETFSELERYSTNCPTHENQSDRLRIILCTPPFATRKAVKTSVANFIERTINTKAQVSLGYLDSCIDALAVGSADAFTTLGTTQLLGFDTLRIGTVNSGALIMESNHLATKPEVSLADFGKRPIAITPEFDFFYDTIVAEYAARNAGVSFEKAELSMLDTYRVLAREHGCFIVPAIPEFGEFFPGAVIRPFCAQDTVPLAINMVTLSTRKSEVYLALERSLKAKLPSISGIYPNRSMVTPPS